MMSAGFQMKRFYVRHDRSSMLVGTDGVLLGAWCPLRSDERGLLRSDERGKLRSDERGKAERDMAGRVFRVLDAGTGCGLIALMIAQRIEESIGGRDEDGKDAGSRDEDGKDEGGTRLQACGYGDWQVDGIDIDAASVGQAAENFALSSWGGRLRACCSDVREWEGTYDLIVTNPPFYNNALVSPYQRRAQARQAGLTLSFEELARSAVRLLSPSGLLGVIVPAREESAMVGCAAHNGLYMHSRCVVCSKPGGMPKRVLMVFGRGSRPMRETSLVLYDAAGSRSEDYARLTERFYL